MIIMGIDASHRNTGVCVAEVMDTGSRFMIKRFLAYHTYRTKKRANTKLEVADMRVVIDRIKADKLQHAVWVSATEIAHSGRSFASSRNVGITWAICLGTDSIPYLSHEVRAMFQDSSKEYAKEKALKYLLSHNFLISQEVSQMNDHEVDAACVALFHLTRIKP